MLGRSVLLFAVLAPFAVGCSAIVDTDPDQLGGADDAGVDIMRDATPGEDGGPDEDGGPGEDTGPGGEDGGEGCSGPPRCDGDTRVACVEGEIERTECEHGCSEGACVPEPDECEEAIPLEPGVQEFDICGDGDDSTHQPSEHCGESEADGPDRLFTFTLEEERDVVIDFTDSDGRAAIDTILYIRSDCEVRSSQLACHDDVSCSVTTIGCDPGDRVQVRQARIQTRLGPGTYYLIADTYRYERDGLEFGCGQVRLSFEVGTGGFP